MIYKYESRWFESSSIFLFTHVFVMANRTQLRNMWILVSRWVTYDVLQPIVGFLKPLTYFILICAYRLIMVWFEYACGWETVIQERRKFGPLGWNVKYDFNNSDLECALATLNMFLEEQPDIPWPALLYVTGTSFNTKFLDVVFYVKSDQPLLKIKLKLKIGSTFISI